MIRLLPPGLRRHLTLTRAGLTDLAVRAVVLLLPAGLQLLATAYAADGARQIFWLGAGLLALLGMVLFFHRRVWQPPTNMLVVALYVMGLVWTWLCAGQFQVEWYPHFAQSVLLVVPLFLFAMQTLSMTGATALRHARLLTQRLLQRKEWPNELSACRTLPEVKALREALHFEASPALVLLADFRPQVRVAALAALEFRKVWKPSQAEMVLNLAQSAREPAVRAAALAALANSDDRLMVEALAAFLRDPSPEVRQAAAEALLWDSERRWNWIRFHVHAALADPVCADDGALPCAGAPLPPQATSDLTEWAAENGVLSVRAALTLIAYYGHVLNSRAGEELVERLTAQMLDTAMPTILRVELAQLLYDHDALAFDVLERLLDPVHPAPLRMLGADALLIEEPYPPAVEALRDIARMPNREIALLVGQIVQRRLGVDLGMNLNHPPDLHTRQAAEVTRRVIQWAAEKPDDPKPAADDELPSRGSGPSLRRGFARRPGRERGQVRR